MIEKFSHRLSQTETKVKEKGKKQEDLGITIYD